MKTSVYFVLWTFFINCSVAFADCDVKSGPPVCTKVKLLSTTLNAQQATCAVTYEEVQRKKQWKVTLSKCPLFPGPVEQFIYKIAYNCNDVGIKAPITDDIIFLDSLACSMSPEENYKKVIKDIDKIQVGSVEKNLTKYNFIRDSHPIPIASGRFKINFYAHPGIQMQTVVRKQCPDCSEFIIAEAIKPKDVKRVDIKK